MAAEIDFCRRQKSSTRIGSLNASPEAVHRSRFEFDLHFDIRNIKLIRLEK